MTPGPLPSSPPPSSSLLNKPGSVSPMSNFSPVTKTVFIKPLGPHSVPALSYWGPIEAKKSKACLNVRKGERETRTEKIRGRNVTVIRGREWVHWINGNLTSLLLSNHWLLVRDRTACLCRVYDSFSVAFNGLTVLTEDVFFHPMNAFIWWWIHVTYTSI